LKKEPVTREPLEREKQREKNTVLSIESVALIVLSFSVDVVLYAEVRPVLIAVVGPGTLVGVLLYPKHPGVATRAAASTFLFHTD